MEERGAEFPTPLLLSPSRVLYNQRVKLDVMEGTDEQDLLWDVCLVSPEYLTLQQVAAEERRQSELEARNHSSSMAPMQSTPSTLLQT